MIRGAGAVGLAAVGATALAACGSDSSAGAPAGGSSSGGSSSAATTTAGARDSGDSGGVAKADVPVGGGVIIASAQFVVTQPAAGEFKAFSSICTHMGCPVAEVADGTINCNCHGSRFDIATGAATRGPGHAARCPAKTPPSRRPAHRRPEPRGGRDGGRRA